MTDRRSASFCVEHDMDFQACPCPDRRRTDRAPLQVLVCSKCNRHCSRCACAEPEFDIRGAA